jgi:hypothetical protein
VFRVGISAPGPPGIADAPLASDNDNPAAPNTGRALLRRFRFEGCFAWDMWRPPISLSYTPSFGHHCVYPFEIFCRTRDAGRSGPSAQFDCLEGCYARGLNYAGLAFIALSDDAQTEFLAEVERLTTSWAAFKSSRLTGVKWSQPKLRVRVKHLAGSKTLRHATVKGLVQ